MEINNTFPKQERLCQNTSITELFKNGKTINLPPLRAVWLFVPDNSKLKILFSAPKRNYKNAVDRNRIKRLLRESFRKNKFELLQFIDKYNLSINIAVIYLGSEILPFPEIEEKMVVLLSSIEREIKRNQIDA